ncbi:helix-turn-helix domain-containing protein [Cellulomonas cellasea]|uniref:XRE family transcriptional regulator n=2 Tax=Cellulomonas cellasea TaxID=43670 RepID=A0A0A0BCA1_9CELL|nr:helix-turn-helix transcriptional regulator [Cellulomonas cellasea]KGM03747.1 XRE family transcriptional regulator [Cellulomonas cellasea DSM 20118]GEA86884.1 hypothetical protein CCE01nite_08330 [Cellulomonas cellasea]
MIDARDDSETMRRRYYRARTTRALADAVQAVRAASGKSQTDLAELIGSSRPTISRMERGQPIATDTVIDALTACGYELVVVPRGSLVTVVPA